MDGAVNKRQEEAARKLRYAAMAWAMQSAKTAVKEDIRAKGQKLGQFSCKEISLLAEDYFAAHMEELVTKAAHDVATWPGFAKLRASAQWPTCSRNR